MPKYRLRKFALVLAALLVCPAVWAAPATQPVPAPKAVNVDNPLGLQLHHFTAAVRDVDRSVQWYRDVLGFRLDLRGSRADGRFQFAEMSIPGYRVTFVAMRDEGRGEGRGNEGRGESRDGRGEEVRRQPAPGWVRITLAVSDPVTLYADMQKRGAKPRTRGSGPLNSFLLSDVDGNEIEFVRIGAETR